MRRLHVTPDPFPHLVEDGMWNHALLAKVVEEFPPLHVPGWKRYSNTLERKLEGPPGLWGPATRELFGMIAALAPPLGDAFGIEGLTMETVGGGYHCIEPGGFLQMHTDFSVSPRTGRYRRLNCLIYLNEDWQDPGGHLELWDDAGPSVDIAPERNRTVVFQTSARSWHGHPVPAARLRRSVAAYFFTDEPPPDFQDQSTVWHPGLSDPRVA